MIDPNTVQKIFDAAEIVEVVSDFVSLKKRGTNYLGLCPFHNEKTPSFVVSPAKGIFKCFGCGEGGNSVNFIMKHESLSYPDALKLLAKKYHIEIQEKEETPEDIEKRNERESMLIVTGFAEQYFRNTLHKHGEGRSVGLKYFRERGFRDDIIEKFGLGYCLEQRDNFTQAAQKQGYKLDFLEKTGLTIVKPTYRFDRFSGRVMFPIHSLSGRVTAFGGRTLKNDKKIAKYLNSPESEIYHKSHILYGIYFAKQAITRADKCYMVEGYTDVISMYQSGIQNVVASSGTSLTEGQIRMVKRFSSNLTILYDGDAAGLKASLRGIDLVLEQEMNVKIVLLPEGEDPDSMAKKLSSEELNAYISENEKDFISFKAELLVAESANDPMQKSRAISDIVRSIAIIPNQLTRSVYVKTCSKLMDVAESVLYAEIAKQKSKKATENHRRQNSRYQQKPLATAEKQSAKPTQSGAFKEVEKEIIRVMLNYGSEEIKLDEDNYVLVNEFIITEIEEDEIEFSVPLYRKIYAEIKTLASFEETHFTRHFDAEISQLTAHLLSQAHSISKFWQRGDNHIDTKEIELNEAVPRLIFDYKHAQIKQLIKENNTALQNEKDSEKQVELIEQFYRLQEISKQLAQKLGDRIFG